jgi:hypothetical protein
MSQAYDKARAEKKYLKLRQLAPLLTFVAVAMFAFFLGFSISLGSRST